MKYIVKIFVVTFLALICTHSFAEQKIVILDLTYVLNQSKAGKGAQDFLKKTYDANQKRFEEIKKQLKKDESDLLTKKNVLSKEEYGKSMNALRKKFSDYQTERRSAIDKLTTKRAQAREALLKKLEPILGNYIKENSISLVVDKKITLGNKPENDITAAIVEKLNKDLPSLNLK